MNATLQKRAIALSAIAILDKKLKQFDMIVPSVRELEKLTGEKFALPEVNIPVEVLLDVRQALPLLATLFLDNPAFCEETGFIDMAKNFREFVSEVPLAEAQEIRAILRRAANTKEAGAE